MYHLHRALNAGRIDLDRFLRVRVVPSCIFECARSADSYHFARQRELQTTRVLAEEQFMKRALIERIHTSLPMGASVHPGWT